MFVFARSQKGCLQVKNNNIDKIQTHGVLCGAVSKPNENDGTER